MHLIDALLDLCSKTQRPVIAIDGPAGAGKTTLAENIKRAISPRLQVTTIHMDDLYDGWDNALSKNLSDSLNILVESHKSIKPLRINRYDWANQAFLPVEEISSEDLLILEGVGSGQRSLRDKLAALIWIEVDANLGFQRVLNRDGHHIEVQMKKWLKTQQQHFQSEDTKKAADFILTT